MTKSRNIRKRTPSLVPAVIQTELASGPADVDNLTSRIPRCRRTLIYHLNKLVKAGLVERVWNTKDLRRPVYRLKVKR